ncbi:aldehyde dehydrogenase family protein [Neobacillus endophyticus]|uniref:aldehyde dehydrogenase family protein n=1 Tax=Neobacillus endophyticus TaxID=2738405 RepID=UPI001C27D83F|nr:aldehyde dehydrogenase family protein [Neobacillus endophyticus]
MANQIKTEMLKGDLYINGQWVSEHDQAYFESVNPATGELVGICAAATTSQVDEAVASAHKAYSMWRDLPVPERASYLMKAGQLFEARKEELARVMTMEMGKVLTESLGEVGVVIATAQYMSGEGRRLFGESVPAGFPDRNVRMVREPLGVAACITPWNFPVSLASYKIFSALIAGNTVVWKPASEVALSAKIFVEILAEAGVPAGVVNLITGSGRTVGSRLAEHPDVQVISFTGSTEVGQQLAEMSCKTLKRISLELGGKNAVIVLKDADLDKAADGIVKSAFTTTGQRCTAASRVIVERPIKQELVAKIVQLTKSMKIGNGLEEGNQVGPLVNESQLHTVESYVKKAVEEGGKIVLGGKRAAELGGFYYEPTIIENVRPHDVIAQEEIFGPVLAIIEADSYEEAMEINNNTIYGLSTAIYTKSLHYANRAAREAVSGLVYINNGTSNAEMGVAFGGMKMSGNGHREVSHHSFDVMTEWKSIYTNY